MRFQGKHQVHAKRTAMLGALLAVVTGCTDVLLVEPPEAPPPIPRQAVKASLCAPPPLVEDVPYKVLFVIDTSLSNKWNDPLNRREDAVRNAILDHITDETVSFGIITFSDVPRIQTFRYTRDLEELNGAMSNIGTHQGGTNYSDTLWTAMNYIRDDLDAVEDSDPQEAARTHYIVFWLSDGQPRIGVTDVNALIPGVSAMVDSIAPRAAEITFNTAFLGGTDPTTPEEIASAESLLSGMAEAGAGEYLAVSQAQASFTFDFDLLPLITHFSFVSALAFNQHAVFGEFGPTADSDADGIEDKQEMDLDLDPTSPDSDGDGFRDGIEMLLRASLDPLEFNSGCSDLTDTDGDSLRDCEEILVGTSVSNPDSDGDGVLDSFEVMMGTSALSNDPALDVDLDGLPDQAEISQHLSPRVANTQEHVEDWGYRYDVVWTNEEDTEAESNCYDLSVSNLSMVQTLESVSHPKGGNVIDLVALFATEGNGSIIEYRRATLQGLYLGPDYQEPASGRFEVSDTDFAELELIVAPSSP
jgi:hypothetical protein